MYYITKKNSETGKKFTIVHNKMGDCLKTQKKISKEVGFDQWRDGYWGIAGGFSAVLFNKDKVIDTKIWKEVRGGYLPKQNSKQGKEIQKILDTCPKVSIDELNECVNFDGAPFKKIGFNANNDEYYGFTTYDDWEIEIPADCTEITGTEYKKIFK